MRTTKKGLLLAPMIAVAVWIPATAGGQSDPPQQTTPTAVATPLPVVDHRCPRGLVSLREYVTYAAKAYRRRALSAHALRRLAYMAKCQHGDWAQGMARRYARRFKAARAIMLDPWKARWNALDAADRAWALGTASCESGMDPHAASPYGDHGAMQFKDSTAAAAGFEPADARMHPLYEQLVRAVWWMHKAGKGQWPVCGRR